VDGRARRLAGWLGLAITVVSWIALARAYGGARQAEGAVEAALADALGADYQGASCPPCASSSRRPSTGGRSCCRSRCATPRSSVRDVEFCRPGTRGLCLDVYRRRDRPTNCPTLLQIHGGWMVGSKAEQGSRSCCTRVARLGVRERRLSALAARRSRSLLDVKQAIRWIREHGAEYGANPDFLVVTGGSAGGHLCALAALTANDPE
jgi:hypothetical protein